MLGGPPEQTPHGSTVPVPRAAQRVGGEKEQRTEQETVSGEVRKERIDVEGADG